MKKALMLCTLALFCLAPETGAWNRVGHAIIAQVAENHMTRKALRKVTEYLEGQPMAAVACDPDTYRGAWAMDIGFVASNAEKYRYKWMTDFDFSTPPSVLPVSHAVTIKADGTPYRTDRDGDRYIENAACYIERWAKELKEGAATMDPQERYRKLVFMIHLMGDIHCPGHICFEGRNDIFGKFPVKYRGKELRYHYFWDYTIFEKNTIFGYVDGTAMVDRATRRERKAVTAGDLWDWVKDSAAQSLPAYEKVPADRELPYAFATDLRPILYTQLRNAGYRLAALLNDIFR